MSELFYRLASYIQEFIYRKGWTELRDAQTRAIEAILDTDDNVIIAAGTASGKTEAAFFPILTVLESDPPKSFGAIYISPLKALINDQFERINDMLLESDIPVFAWHGDRSQSEKARATRTRSGILQITPESLEALIMNRSGELKQMLSGLRFVVIDEMHAFMGQDRGVQLLCQLARIESLTQLKPRRIGLSATINDYGAAKRWLSAGTLRAVTVIESREGGRRLNLAMEHFDNTQKEADYEEHIYSMVYGRKCIVFANSRAESESIADTLRKLAAEKGDPDVFYVHHGSLSATVRAETELSLKRAEGPAVAVATRTLELGIDLGGLDRVVQIGAAGSCSSFVQRLGRTGRRGNPAEMRFVTRASTKENGAFDDISWELLQNIAVIQLYLEERWVETPREKARPYSVLFHQTLSVLAQGGLRPSELARRVLSLPILRNVSTDDYKALLSFAIEKDLIEKTEEGELIIGLAGERLTNHYRFYSVFIDNTGYKVYSIDRELGEIDALPDVGDVLILAGRRWEVSGVDEARGNVYVAPTKSGKRPVWVSSAVIEIDDRVAKRMRKLLCEDTEYGYLNERARMHLSAARAACRQTGILTSDISGKDTHFCIHPWLGSRAIDTLRFLLNTRFKTPLGISSAKVCHNIMIEVDRNPAAGDFIDGLKTLIGGLTEDDISFSGVSDSALKKDRYDFCVPRALLEKAYIANTLDIKGLAPLHDMQLT